MEDGENVYDILEQITTNERIRSRRPLGFVHNNLLHHHHNLKTQKISEPSELKNFLDNVEIENDTEDQVEEQVEEDEDEDEDEVNEQMIHFIWT